MSKALPLHRRLSRALCETVDYGTPTRIRIAKRDWLLIAEELRHLLAPGHGKGFPDQFEGVPVQREPRPFEGCVIEHSNDRLGPVREGIVPDTLVIMRDSGQAAFVAWKSADVEPQT